MGDRVYARDGIVYRGYSPKRILAVEQRNICRPGLSDEELVKAFIRVSEVGGTALCFDLQGFNAGGTSIDPDHVAAAVRLKDAANERWMPTVIRVLGSLTDADFETRLSAVRIAAETFQEDFSVFYWIEGPDSAALVKAFRTIAPDLTVIAARGGQVDVVSDPRYAWTHRPAVLVGSVPTDSGPTRHCILPDHPDSYAALEAYNTEPNELEAWYPSTIGLSFDEVNDGWVVLFNGHGLEAWSTTGWNQKAFVSKDGVIVRAMGGGGSLQTHDRYDNFILRLQWKLHRPGANSGIFLRAPRENRESKMGFEFQLMGDSGEDPHKNGTGAVYDVVAPSANASKPVGRWNDLEIFLNGPHYRAILNGVLVQDLNFDDHDELRHRLRNGFIALQDHGNEVSFKNIRIRRL